MRLVQALHQRLGRGLAGAVNGGLPQPLRQLLPRDLPIHVGVELQEEVLQGGTLLAPQAREDYHAAHHRALQLAPLAEPAHALHVVIGQEARRRLRCWVLHGLEPRVAQRLRGSRAHFLVFVQERLQEGLRLLGEHPPAHLAGKLVLPGNLVPSRRHASDRGMHHGAEREEVRRRAVRAAEQHLRRHVAICANHLRQVAFLGDVARPHDAASAEVH
mmetsp:Transcript_86632/g.223122  ORF Transcript_86632/g.223122 Transcript_86632/m.223122 type:complete len:216 (+) Transcript_86632:365-1012(+)